MKTFLPPIFCDHCARLALALIDGEILCAACLLPRVNRCGAQAPGVRPLPLDTPHRSRQPDGPATRVARRPAPPRRSPLPAAVSLPRAS